MCACIYMCVCVSVCLSVCLCVSVCAYIHFVEYTLCVIPTWENFGEVKIGKWVNLNQLEVKISTSELHV